MQPTTARTRVLKLAEYWSLYVSMHNTNTTEPGRAENSVEGIPSRVMGPFVLEHASLAGGVVHALLPSKSFVFPSCKNKRGAVNLISNCLD